MDHLLNTIESLLYKEDEYSKTSSCNFISSLKFMGKPILPPVLSETQRSDLRLLKKQAVHVEAKIKAKAREKLIARVKSVIQDIDSRKVKHITMEPSGAEVPFIAENGISQSLVSSLTNFTGGAAELAEGSSLYNPELSSQAYKSLDSGYLSRDLQVDNLHCCDSKLEITKHSGELVLKQNDNEHEAIHRDQAFEVNYIETERHYSQLSKANEVACEDTSCVSTINVLATGHMSFQKNNSLVHSDDKVSLCSDRQRVSDSYDHTSNLTSQILLPNIKSECNRPSSAPPSETLEYSCVIKRTLSSESINVPFCLNDENRLSLLAKVDLDQHNETLDDINTTPIQQEDFVSNITDVDNTVENLDESEDEHFMMTVKPNRSQNNAHEKESELGEMRVDISIAENTTSTDLAGYMDVSLFETSESQVSTVPLQDASVTVCPLSSERNMHASKIAAKNTNFVASADENFNININDFDLPGSKQSNSQFDEFDTSLNASSLGPRSSYTVLQPSPLLIAAYGQPEEKDMTQHLSLRGIQPTAIKRPVVDLTADDDACQLTGSMENLNVNSVQRRLVYDDSCSTDDLSVQSSSVKDAASEDYKHDALNDIKLNKQKQLDHYLNSLQKMPSDVPNTSITDSNNMPFASTAPNSHKKKKEINNSTSETRVSSEDSLMVQHLSYLEQIQQQMMHQHQQQLEELLTQQQQQLILWQEMIAVEQRKIITKAKKVDLGSKTGESELVVKENENINGILSQQKQYKNDVLLNGSRASSRQSNSSNGAKSLLAHGKSADVIGSRTLSSHAHVKFSSEVKISEVPRSDSYDSQIACAQGMACIESPVILKVKNKSSSATGNKKESPNTSNSFSKGVKQCDNIISEQESLLKLTLENIPIELQQRFVKLSALIKGYLTRRLLKSEKVQMLIRTIADTASFALSIQQETPVKKGTAPLQDRHLQQQVLAQLTAAMYEIHEIFFELPMSERMAIIAQTRVLELERLFKSQDVSVPRRRISLATRKALERKLNSRSLSSNSRSKTLPIMKDNGMSSSDYELCKRKTNIDARLKGNFTKVVDTGKFDSSVSKYSSHINIASNVNITSNKNVKATRKPLSTTVINNKSTKQYSHGHDQHKLQLAVKSRKVAVSRTLQAGQ